jgi:hypothetical protein
LIAPLAEFSKVIVLADELVIAPLRALAVKIPTAAKSSAAAPELVAPATVIVSFFRISKR